MTIVMTKKAQVPSEMTAGILQAVHNIIAKEDQQQAPSDSVYERIHRVQNYHYYIIYKLGKEKHQARMDYHTTF